MWIFDIIFRRKKTQVPTQVPTQVLGLGSASKQQTQRVEPHSHQLPSGMVAQEFGEVNVSDLDGVRTVDLTVLMEPTGADSEGWQTGVAIDGSVSMYAAYGNGFAPGPGVPPMDAELRASFLARSLMIAKPIDGKTRLILTDAGIAELRRLGHTETPNTVEPVARNFTAYLADRLDADGGTTVIYWACGSGAEYEVIGDFTAAQCAGASFTGPSKGVGFGTATMLVPAMKYFVERFVDAKNGMYVFITDGKVDDIGEVKRYTISLCQQISAGTRNRLKFILIGVGAQIDEAQMSELDDLDSGTEVDLWDHKIAAEMRQLAEIFAELVSENQIVAPTGKVVSQSGAVVKMMSDGVPARIRFQIEPREEWFELVIGEHRIRQTLPAVRSQA